MGIKDWYLLLHDGLVADSTGTDWVDNLVFVDKVWFSPLNHCVSPIGSRN